ncbi:hypothetical protein Pint_08343 [Pistacia integerrima]|uniref:Uncharacterized protein n=1 Tax=Pistacia integerrima TaxID=434235 RepID=A0ACC0XU17_9ROSI|nr:hypothetical protein Pint_08343 [Pistacia integerrima]
MQVGIDQKAEDEKIKATQEALEHCKNNLEAVINVFKQEKIGILSDTLRLSCHEENDVTLEIPTHGENGEVMEVTQASSECKEMEIELNSIEVVNELATKEVFEVEIVGNTYMGVPQKQNDPHGEAFETVCNGGKHFEELACESEKIFEDVEEVDAAIEQEEDKSNFEFSRESWANSGKNMEGTRLKSENYPLWREQVLALAESQELVAYLTGEVTIPEVVLPPPEEARSLAPYLKRLLGLSLDWTTSAQVCRVLKEAYAQASQERQFQLTQQLNHMKKDPDMPLNDYLRKFKGVCDNLSIIGFPVDDKTKVFSLLNGLGARYEPFTTSMLKPPMPSYPKVVPLLQSYETRISLHSPDSIAYTAFYGQKNNSKFTNKGARNQHLQLSTLTLETNNDEWISDTGASAHMTSHEGSSDTKGSNERTQAG